MSEQVALELFRHGDAEPEEFAAIVAPVWETVLFGDMPIALPGASSLPRISSALF